MVMVGVDASSLQQELF